MHCRTSGWTCGHQITDTTNDATPCTLPEKKYHQFLYTISLSCSSQVGFGSADEAGRFMLDLALDVLKGQHSSWPLANNCAELLVIT